MYQDRCHKEVEKKLSEFNLISEAKAHILLHLLQHDFLNEERFAKSFVRGKFRIKKWGKHKIIRELKLRNISTYNITYALKEIDESNYLKTFNELVEKRLQQITDKDIYKKRKKLADYLIYRGWESNLVYQKIEKVV